MIEGWLDKRLPSGRLSCTTALIGKQYLPIQRHPRDHSQEFACAQEIGRRRKFRLALSKTKCVLTEGRR